MFYPKSFVQSLMLMAHRVLIKDQNEAIQMCQYGCFNFDSFFF